MAEKPKRNPSIVDVAEKAGVSAGTVSRVINSNPKISAATVKRVVSAMSDLGYEPPHPTRRRGKSSRAQQGIHSSQIAIVPLGKGSPFESLSPVMARTLSGIQKALEREDLSMVISAVENLSRLPAILDPKQTDGIILAGDAPPEQLRGAFGNMPAVYIFNTPASLQAETWFDRVLPDNDAIGGTAYEYLRDKGRKQLAFLNPAPTNFGYQERGQAFVRLAREAGCAANIAVAEDAEPAFETAPLATRVERVSAMLDQVLALETKPDGLFLPCDSIAGIVQAQLMRRGIVPGKDITIVSCNNDEEVLAGLFPRPASIDIRPDLVGDRAVDQLLWRIANRNSPGGARVTVPPKLIDGEL